jgi:hypothetical protein
MGTLTADLQAEVETFVERITKIIQRDTLETLSEAIRAEQALDGKKTTRKSPRAVSSSGRKAKRSPEELEALGKALLKEITKNPGRRMEEIAEAMDVTTKDLVLPVRKLWDEKQIKAKGAKRATKYYPK